jgi:hypothetical protein
VDIPDLAGTQRLAPIFVALRNHRTWASRGFPRRKFHSLKALICFILATCLTIVHSVGKHEVELCLMYKHLVLSPMRSDLIAVYNIVISLKIAAVYEYVYLSRFLHKQFCPVLRI